MATVKNTTVNMEKTKACTKPTNISKTMNGKGTIRGTKKNITISSTSPANMLPKSLKENEIILAISAISSSMPVKN